MQANLLNKRLCFLLSISILLNIFCSKKPSNPTSFDFEDFPAAPINLKAEVGDGIIKVTWTHPQQEAVETYKVYRQDSTGQVFRNIGSTAQLFYTDSNLQNNQEYRYQVSAVGKNGVEGTKSTMVSAIPAVYGVSINFGQVFTTSQTVTLSFTAPLTTSIVKISNDDSLFTKAQWERFVTARNWTLSFEDGKKTVYVKFRDAEDRETIEPYADSIILDTEAIIKKVTQDSDGRVLANGDTIHFTVVTDEPKGKAWVNLGLIQSGINLFDDGSNGDSVPDDGIYEVDYDIPTGAEGEKASVFGNFIDRAGNVASKLRASGAVTVRRSPKAVNLISVSPAVSSSTSLNLFWTENTDDDFANYRIFRSNAAGVNTESPLVTIIQDQATLSHADTTLVPNTTYYYRVYVFDISGLFSGSNEVSGTTNP